MQGEIAKQTDRRSGSEGVGKKRIKLSGLRGKNIR
jgi:hypothetical protein